MAMIRGTFLEFNREMQHTLKTAREILSKHGLGDIQMGQISSYEALQQAMMQQSAMQQNQYQCLIQQGISGAGVNAGLLGQLYPNKIVAYPDGYRESRQTVWQKWAEFFGFKEDFDTGGFKHPNGGFVSRQWLENVEGSTKSVESLFKRALTPNIHWLDDRINEIRVRL